MNSIVLSLSLSLSLSFVAGSLAAQNSTSGVSTPTTEPAVELDPLVVIGSRGASLTNPDRASARSEILLTPGGGELIDPGWFRRGRASTVEDTFALSPGVHAQSRFGSDEARLSIRGSGIQRTFHGRGLRILQDGVPLNLADGGFDMQAFEPLSAAYITIWRGANALAYGGSTLGGAIDYVSHTGREHPRPNARIETGSWGYTRINAAGGGQRGALDVYASLTYQGQDGFREHAVQRNHRLFANVGRRIGGNAETRFFLTAVDTVSELPGSLSLAQVESDPRVAAAGNKALDQHRDFGLLRLANKTTVRTGSTVWDFVASWSYKDLDHPIFQVVDQLSNDATLGVKGAHAGQWLGLDHRLRGGVFLTYGRTEAANFVNSAGERGELVSKASQRATNFEVFVEDQIRLSREWTIVFGGAAAHNERDNDRIVGGAPSYALEYERVMPKLGVRWERDGVQVFGNVAGSYEPPSFSEALTLNAARRSQTATSIELGTRGRRGAIRWDATLYHARLEHELLAIDHDNNPATPSATVNAERTTHSGAELGGEIDLLALGREHATGAPSSRLVLRAVWTYGLFQFDDDPAYGDNTLAGLPEHLVRAELSWEQPSGWYFGPTLEWVDETFIDHRNTFAAPGHLIWGARIGFRPDAGLAWFLEGRNLGNRRYAATTGVVENAGGLDQAQFLPGDGRGVYAGLEFSW